MAIQIAEKDVAQVVTLLASGRGFASSQYAVGSTILSTNTTPYDLTTLPRVGSR